jgi:hypothetical protein
VRARQNMKGTPGKLVCRTNPTGESRPLALLYIPTAADPSGGIFCNDGVKQCPKSSSQRFMEPEG